MFLKIKVLKIEIKTILLFSQVPISGTIDPNCKIIFSDIKQFVNKYVYEVWKTQWESNNNNKLNEIIKNPTNNISDFGLSRKDRIIITRLRIGHTNFSHKFIIERTPPPMCNCINNQSFRKH